MPSQSLDEFFEMARDISETCFGHRIGRFETCGQHAASAECTRPGCNMGLTAQDDIEGYQFAVLGAAIVYHCASSERPLQDPLTLLYRADPLEGR